MIEEEKLAKKGNFFSLMFYMVKIRGSILISCKHLRTFAPIATAHPYSARKFTCHNDRADAHCYSFVGYNDLECSVTPTFLFRNRFYLQLSPHCPKMNKKSMWEVKKISRFLSSGHGILPSCGCKAHETMVAKCELVL